MTLSPAQEYVTAYHSLERKSARAVARRAYISAMATGDRLTGRLQARLRQPRVHLFLLHYIFQDEEQGFDRFLRWLLAHEYHILSYSEAVRRAAEGPIDKPYISFTFDDGIENCVKAAEILRRYDASACFFLSTRWIGEQRLIEPRRFGANAAPVLVRYMSWDDVDAVLAAGHEVGGHTHSHTNLADMNEQQLLDDIGKNKDLLTQRCGPVRHFAWPFGGVQHFSRLAQTCVFQSGYESCASAVRGAHFRPDAEARGCLRRDRMVAAWPLRHMAYFLSQGRRGGDALPCAALP